jgi:hypothetical protein
VAIFLLLVVGEANSSGYASILLGGSTLIEGFSGFINKKVSL